MELFYAKFYIKKEIYSKEVIVELLILLNKQQISASLIFLIDFHKMNIMYKLSIITTHLMFF